MPTQYYRDPSILLLVILLFTFSLISCGSHSNNTSITLPSKLYGIWEHIGYGEVINVDKNGGTEYQFTRATCLKTETINNNELNNLFAQAKLSTDQSSLEVRAADSPTFMSRYQRRKNLPNSCTGKGLITTATPSNTFEHLWHTFNDYYAFFDKRHIDWTARYAEFQPLVNDTMQDEQLFELLSNLLSPLDDDHIEFEAGDEWYYSPAQIYGVEQAILNVFQQQQKFSELDDFSDALEEQYASHLNAYLDPKSIRSVEGSSPKVAQWGTIKQTIGYFHIENMENFSALDNGSNTLANLRVIHDFMPRLIRDLQHTKAMIIDVRFNTGGEDSISLAIASYFADRRRQVLSKKARYWAGETKPVNAIVNPAQIRYLKPIIVLGSKDTLSAAEIFLMVMNAFPHVTLMGENSSGALSDLLNKKLPNGWSVSLSNEVYMDATGNEHEVTGIPPEINVSPFSIKAIANGKNAAIEKALRQLKP